MINGNDDTTTPAGGADELNESDLDKVTGGASKLPAKKKPSTIADPDEGGEVF